MKRFGRYTFAAFTASACFVFSLFTNSLYLYTDNVGVALVLNGYYAGPLSQYQHPLLCLLVNAPEKLFPSADVYTAFVHVLIFAELFVLALLLPEDALKKRLSERRLRDHLCAAVSVLFIVFLSAGMNLWQANYTIQAGSFLFTGWLVLDIANARKKSSVWVIAGTLFVAFGYMLRKEAGLLFLPFALLRFAAELFGRKKEDGSGGFLRIYLPAFITLALLMSSQAALDRTEPYASAKRYNAARTALVDFPVKKWNDKDAGFSRFDPVDYTAACEWFYADTEVMTVDLLETMAETGTKNRYELNPAGLKRALREMGITAGKTDVYMSVMVVLCLLTAVRNILAAGSPRARSAAALAVAGAFVILLYFTFRGRAPLRVWQPALFGALFVEVSILMTCAPRGDGPARELFLLLAAILLYWSAGQVIAHTEEFHGPVSALNARTGADDSAYEQTLRGDDLYIWPNWHAAVPKHFGQQGKLPTLRVLEHNIPLGDWSSGQPYYTEFLSRISHPNPIRDLAEKPNVYIMTDSGFILSFLRLHYGEDIELVPAGEVDGTTAFRVERGRTAPDAPYTDNKTTA